MTAERTRARSLASRAPLAGRGSNEPASPASDVAFLNASFVQLKSSASLVDRLSEAPVETRARAVNGLQRTHGNDFVQRAIADFQRRVESSSDVARSDITPLARVITQSTSGAGGENDAPPKGPLSDAEVETARKWYVAHGAKYTPEIIKKIQEQVGTEQTGAIDTATIQGVAKFQQANPPLWVDGIAGPRTMPAAFPVGLAKSSEVEGFVKEAKQVQADWAKLKTGAERAKALADAVNKHLAAAGVPVCKDVVKDLGNDSGQFDFTTWSLFLGQGPFSKATITDEEAADIADTVFHESRHCEQWFMMAQMLAGKKLKAAVIATTMSIPANIATAAVANPIKQGTTEAIQAEGWYDSVYGSNADYRNKVLDNVEATDNARKKAEENYKKNPTPANKAKLEAATAKFEAAHKRYMELPEEADAWRVGGQVTAAYLKDDKK